jgi:hypothetical protein
VLVDAFHDTNARAAGCDLVPRSAVAAPRADVCRKHLSQEFGSKFDWLVIGIGIGPHRLSLFVEKTDNSGRKPTVNVFSGEISDFLIIPDGQNRVKT